MEIINTRQNEHAVYFSKCLNFQEFIYFLVLLFKSVHLIVNEFKKIYLFL